MFCILLQEYDRRDTRVRRRYMDIAQLVDIVCPEIQNKTITNC